MPFTSRLKTQIRFCIERCRQPGREHTALGAAIRPCGDTLGLLFIVPLRDVMENRRVIVDSLRLIAIAARLALLFAL